MPLENTNNIITQSATLVPSVEIQKKIDERNMNTLATQLSIIIDTNLAKQNISFDIQTFKSKIIKYLEQVYLNPDIPSIAKDKFKDDILKKINLLSTIEPSDITSLRKNRNFWSLGIESLELQTKFGNDEVKKQAYFFEKILDKNIREYIEPVSKSLMVTFSESQKQIGITQYHEKTLNTFQKNISLLDKKYGIDAMAEIDKITKDTKRNTGGDISREDLYRKIGMYIVNALNKKNPIPLGYHIQGIIKNGRLGQWSKQGKWTEAITPSGPKDIVDIVLEYGQIIWKFERTEWEIRETRSIALATGVSTDIKNILWMDQLKSEFDHITPENVEKKLKNASFADTVILITQLTQLTPVIGDIWSWFDGIINAYSGINVDGAKLTTLERSLYGIFGVLWITVVGGIATRAHKAWKITQLLRSLEGIKKYLPEKLENFLKTSGKISESVKNQIIAFGKMMGGEVAIRIENMMIKNWTILWLTEPLKYFDNLKLVNIPRTNGKITKISWWEYIIINQSDTNILIRWSENWIIQEKLLSKIEFEKYNPHFVTRIENQISNSEKQWIIELSPYLKTQWEKLTIEQRRLIMELYPIWINEQSKQGNVGNCYFMATLNSLKWNTDTLEYLTKVIKKVDGGWEVTFLGFISPNNKTLITPADLAKNSIYSPSIWTIQIFSEWPLGDKILERAYWRLRDHRASIKGSNDFGNTIQELPYRGKWWNTTLMHYGSTDNTIFNKTTHTAWYTKIVMEDLLGLKTQRIFLDNQDKKSIIENLKIANKQEGLITLSTKWSPNADRDTFDVETKDWIKRFFSQHAYSMWYRSDTNDIIIMNPHDSLHERHIVSIDEFMKNWNFEIIEIGTKETLNITNIKKQTPEEIKYKRIQNSLIAFGTLNILAIFGILYHWDE